jgi:RNA polymerase sigma-70 factor (ECF subfamily)
LAPETDPSSGPGDVTLLLRDFQAGNKQVLDELLPKMYGELKRLANLQMQRESAGHTLQPTALVHEAYLRLVRQEQVDWHNRAQFFGLAAQMMRRILLNHARDKKAAKRGGLAEKLSLEAALELPQLREVELERLEEALTRLAEFDPEQARLVELRFFSGLTIEQAAHVLGVSPATIKREWTVARAWLLRELS